MQRARLVRPGPLGLALALSLAPACGDDTVPADDEAGDTGGSEETTGESSDGSETESSSDSDTESSSDTDTSSDTDSGSGTDSDSGSDTDTGADPDEDRDGYPASVDCDDDNPEIHPDQDERCNGLDDDCDPDTGEDGLVTVDGLETLDTLTEAVAVAEPGAEIRACPGLYEENLVIAKALSLVAQAGPEQTTIDGGGIEAVIQVESGGPVEIVGFTLTGGQSFGHGGGVGITSVDPVTIEGCVITGNSSSDGAGVYTYSGAELHLLDTDIVENTGEIGGGMEFQGDLLEVVGGSLSGNTASESGGAAVLFGGGLVSFEGTSVVGNEAPLAAGLFIDAEVTVTNATIHANVAGFASGGARIIGAGLLESVTSDWGAGLEDNLPEDVEVVGVGSYASFAADASFSCDAQGCI